MSFVSNCDGQTLLVNSFCTLILKKALNEMGAMDFMREREEGNEIRIALPTVAHLSPPLPQDEHLLHLYEESNTLLHICTSEMGHKP